MLWHNPCDYQTLISHCFINIALTGILYEKYRHHPQEYPTPAQEIKNDLTQPQVQKPGTLCVCVGGLCGRFLQIL